MAEDKSMRSALDILSRNTSLPIISNYSLSEFVEDPAYWLWRLSRYKHVSRLLKGKSTYVRSVVVMPLPPQSLPLV